MNADLADLKEKNIPSILPKGSTTWSVTEALSGLWASNLALNLSAQERDET